MPHYTLQYQHHGALYEVLIPAHNLDDAKAHAASLKATGELDGYESVEEHDADHQVVAWAQVRNEAVKELSHG